MTIGVFNGARFNLIAYDAADAAYRTAVANLISGYDLLVFDAYNFISVASNILENADSAVSQINVSIAAVGQLNEIDDTATISTAVTAQGSVSYYQDSDLLNSSGVGIIQASSTYTQAVDNLFSTGAAAIQSNANCYETSDIYTADLNNYITVTTDVINNDNTCIGSGSAFITATAPIYIDNFTFIGVVIQPLARHSMNNVCLIQTY